MEIGKERCLERYSRLPFYFHMPKHGNRLSVLFARADRESREDGSLRHTVPL